MGRVAGPWGVRGWIKVVPYGDGPAGLAAQRAWWLRSGDKAWRSLRVTEAKVHGNTVVAAIEGFADPESAATLSGSEVAVPRDALPRLRHGEFYLDDLVGLEVKSSSGALLGIVLAVEEYGGPPLLRVGQGAVERLIPCVAPILESVDVDGGGIVVAWEPGY
jgi:16S rRNA processing protein RimM